MGAADQGGVIDILRDRERITSVLKFLVEVVFRPAAFVFKEPQYVCIAIWLDVGISRQVGLGVALLVVIETALNIRRIVAVGGRSVSQLTTVAVASTCRRERNANDAQGGIEKQVDVG